MPLEDYGFILVLLASEGLLSAVTSYPSIKDVLVRQDIAPAELWRFSILFACVALPVTLGFLVLRNDSLILTVVVIIAAFVSGLSQVALCMLRVAELNTYNYAKLIWAFVTTMAFLVLLPFHWAFLPVVYGVGVLSLLRVLSRTFQNNDVQPAFKATSGYFFRGGIIYCTQALVNVYPQHGTRLFIAATMTLVDVAAYTQIYMLATSLFFVYSAVMIVFEPKLSRSAPLSEVRKRLVLAMRLSTLFIGLALIHFAALYFLSDTGVLSIVMASQVVFQMPLFAMLMIFIALNGVQTVLNCILLALSRRDLSLLSSALGSVVLIIGMMLVMSQPDLISIGVLLALSQAVMCLFPAIYIVTTISNTDDGH